MEKRKIAICFYGYVGVPFNKSMNYESGKKILNKNNRIDKIMMELSYAHIKNDIIDKNPDFEFDIFIHSWNYKIKKEINETFNPKSSIIENLITEHDVNIIKDEFNQNLSRMLGTVKVLDLLKDYKDKNNIEYQQVILTRFDIALTEQFKIENYINNNMKIVDGFHKGNWNKEPEIYNDKKLEEINKKYSNTNIEVNFLKKEIRIIENIFMSSFNNIYKLVQYYYKIKEMIKFNNNTINWNPHIYYSNMLLDIITKSNENIKIQKIKELYFEGMNENDTIPEESTLLLTKQMYFRNPGCNFNFGTIKGNIKGRIINIRELLEKYEIPEEIIKACV